MKKYITIALMAFFMIAASYTAAFAAAPNPSQVQGVVNINTATKAELMKLPWVSKEVADNIINARDINGPFNSPDDLLNVQGVTPELLKQIRSYVVVKGPTNIRREKGR